MTKPACKILFLLLLLSGTAWAQSPPAKVGGVTPGGALVPFAARDANTGAGTDWTQGTQVIVPTAAGGVAASATAPLPVTIPAAFPGAVTAEGVVAEHAASSTADPLVTGSEARALGALPADVHAGDAVRVRASLSGIPYVTLADPAGTYVYGAAATPLRVDPTGTTAQPVTDNGGILTVDGTVTANQGSPPWAENITQIGSAAFGQGQRAAAASLSVVPDSGGTLFPVTGTAANAAAALPAVQPVIAGWDTAAVRAIITDAAGHLQVDALSLPAITGSVTADTELPVAAAPSETYDNPTVPGVSAFGMLWDIADGAGHWERIPGTAAAGLKAVVTGAVNNTPPANQSVNLAQIAATATSVNAGAPDAGTIRVQPARCSSSAILAGTVQNGVSKATIAARPGRCSWSVQQRDPDGVLSVVQGATTNVCGAAGTDGVWLNPSAAVNRAGGSDYDTIYSGVIELCAPEGGTTISYYYEETF